MLAIYGIAVGLAIGWLRGGRLAGLRQVRLRLAWVVLPIVPLQAVLIGDPGHVLRDPGVAGVLVLLSYVPLVVFVAANLHLPALRLVALGLGANLLVMLANGGLMPVSPDSLRAAGRAEDSIVVGARTTSSKDVILPVAETRFAFLSDTIVTPPLPRHMIISVGDILTFGGLALAMQAAMRRQLPLNPVARRAGAALPAPD